MMGDSKPQQGLFYSLSLEPLVPRDHPLLRIRPLVDEKAVRRVCRGLYSTTGRPSIPPEQLFLAMAGGYLLGVTSGRRLVMELQCNMALRWFVGLTLDQDAWNASTSSQNRRRRFDRAGVLQKLFDATVRRAIAEGLVSPHVSADGTLVRADASFKSFVLIEVAMNPEEYKRKLRADDDPGEDDRQDPGNRAVYFRSEKRSNKTHRSTTDPDCRFVTKRTSGTGAYPGYTLNAVMENRNRFLLGIGVEIFQGSASEESGCLALLRRARHRVRHAPRSLGADKGYFHEESLEQLLERRIKPHVATDDRGRSRSHARVPMRRRGLAYRFSQRCRKKIEELFREAKDLHGLRRFPRRGLSRVRQESFLVAWVLNLKRLAKLQPPATGMA